MTRPSFVALVDIPSSYRIQEFNVLSDRMRLRGIDMRVWFMSGGQRGRLWQAPRETRFDYRIGRGPTLYLGESLPVHFNPGIWANLRKAPPTWLMAGTWYQPAVMASVLGGRAKCDLLWNESAEARAHTGTSTEKLKSVVVRRFDGFVVPGVRAAKHIQGYADRPILDLPNFVSEAIYRDRVAELHRDRDATRRTLGLRSGSTLCFWPARLNAVKGILPFLEAVAGTPGDFLIAIAGVGPQRQAIEEFLSASRATNVKLLGHLWQDDLLRYYAAADVLLLPSLFEPWGFVTVEALWAGLPMIISDRVGAAPEVLDGNGWVVDPLDRQSVRGAFQEAVEASPAHLREMGRRSQEIAGERFASERSADTFIEELLSTFPP